MLKKFSKGSNSGMSIRGIGPVISSLAGLGVIYQVVGTVGAETGQDHDRAELQDLGSAIENKCTDLAGTSDSTSFTAITVDTEIRSDATLSPQGEDGNLRLQMSYGSESDTDSYELPGDECDITITLNDDNELGPGQYQIEVSGEDDGSGDPEITVEGDP